MQGASKRGSEAYLLCTLSFRLSGNEAELARSSFARVSIINLISNTKANK